MRVSIRRIRSAQLILATSLSSAADSSNDLIPEEGLRLKNNSQGAAPLLRGGTSFWERSCRFSPVGVGWRPPSAGPLQPPEMDA